MKAVLVLCTGNSARSILGEVLLETMGRGRVRGFSAGSRPAGAVHPGALRLLTRKGIDISGLRSKSWSEFAGKAAMPVDIVLTVCANAAGEACPVFPGRAIRAHWGLADPAGVAGGERAEDAAFERTWELMRNRVTAFLALRFEDMAHVELERALSAIGRMDGAA